MYKTIFLSENEEDILKALKSQDIDTKVFEHRLAGLFNRVYNNYVGYYVFRQDDMVYKVIVLPKTIKPSQSAEKEFVNYLLHYYRINNIHKLDREKKIPDSLLRLAFEINNSEKNSHNILNEFQSHRYEAILQSIEGFFKRHKHSKRIKVDYTSQSIKHRLNLAQNIKELDKTKIHQLQYKDVIFSMFATVTYQALKLFITQKYIGLDREYSDKLFVKVKKLQNMLLKKYKIERGYKLSIATLNGIKLDKLFSKKEENRQLFVDIKSLFGFEQMYKDDAMAVKYRDDLMTTSLFINPNDFYEWYVYDILKKYADDNDKTICFDKKGKTVYLLNDKAKSSNPDYVLMDTKNKTKIVVDAKWKNVNKFGDIKPSDYLKLKFDSSLIERQGYSVSSYLIYPQISIDERSFNMQIDNKTVFDFNITEISMEFTKLSKGLDFNFDAKELQDSIEKNTQLQHLKTISEELTATIANQRTSAITKLIDEEDNDKKEELRVDLDEQLSLSALELSEKIKEQKILPEIDEILKKYDTALEDESKKFLKSSSMIYSYYKEKAYEHFDYSMPGSGFWKLIELELNTSFVWYLRILSKVCDSKSSWVKVCKINTRINQRLDNGKKVALTQPDKHDKLKLQSIMFGGIKLLLEDASTLGEFNTFFDYDNNEENFIKNDIITFIEKIIIFRNEHAHIKAMSLEDFEKLWELLFSKVDDEYIFLEKLLDFKRSISDFIKLPQT